MNTSVDEQKDPDALEREVDARRANLNQTLNAVEQRLSPNHLMEQTMDYFGQHGGDIAQSVSRSIKDNPLPLLLTGVGIAWLMSSQSRTNNHSYRQTQYRDRLTQWDDGGFRPGARQSAYSRTNPPAGDYSQEIGDGYTGSANASDDDSVKDSVEQKFGQWSDTAEQWKDDLSTQLKSMKQGAEESSEAWQERVISASVEHSESMQYRMRQANQQVGSQAREQAQNVKNFMQEQPLVAAALGVAAGALIGALLPATAAENKMVGDKADDLKASLADTAQSVGADVSSAVSSQAKNLREKGEEKISKIADKESTTAV